MADRETLDGPTRAFEAIALGLRRVDGLGRGAFAREFGADPIDAFADAIAETTRTGLIEIDGDRLRLSPEGRLFASEVLVEFAPAAPARR